MRSGGERPGHLTTGMLFVGAVLLLAAVLASGCALFAAEKAAQSSPVEVQFNVRTTATTVPQITGTPGSIVFLSVPAIGSRDPVRGRVSGASPGDHDVVVYIYVNGWYGPKPLWEKPLTPISGDGTWSCDIATTDTDLLATEIIAYVVPAGFVPPRLDGDKELPASLSGLPFTRTKR